MAFIRLVPLSRSTKWIPTMPNKCAAAFRRLISRPSHVAVDLTAANNIQSERCPACSNLSGYRISYAYPTQEAQLLVRQGKLRLGGCITNWFEFEGRQVKVEPDRFCSICQHEWQSWQPEVDMKTVKMRYGAYLWAVVNAPK